MASGVPKPIELNLEVQVAASEQTFAVSLVLLLFLTLFFIPVHPVLVQSVRLFTQVSEIVEQFLLASMTLTWLQVMFFLNAAKSVNFIFLLVSKMVPQSVGPEQITHKMVLMYLMTPLTTPTMPFEIFFIVFQTPESPAIASELDSFFPGGGLFLSCSALRHFAGIWLSILVKNQQLGGPWLIKFLNFYEKKGFMSVNWAAVQQVELKFEAQNSSAGFVQVPELAISAFNVVVSLVSAAGMAAFQLRKQVAVQSGLSLHALTWAFKCQNRLANTTIIINKCIANQYLQKMRQLGYILIWRKYLKYNKSNKSHPLFMHLMINHSYPKINNTFSQIKVKCTYSNAQIS